MLMLMHGGLRGRNAAIYPLRVFVIYTPYRYIETAWETRREPRQAEAAQPPAPHRGPGPRGRAHDRRGPLLHRRPDPAAGHTGGGSAGGVRDAQGAPGPLHRVRHRQRRPGRTAPEGQRTDRAARARAMNALAAGAVVAAFAFAVAGAASA